MTVILIIKEVKVKGYYRKSGSWVTPHIRTIKVKPKNITSYTTFYKKKYNNPHQLEFNFTKED